MAFEAKRDFLIPAMALIAACFILHPAVCLGAENPRPNVVMILADDQGWGDLSASGNVNLSTPHVDSLARDGASLDRFYVCAVCSPTRAEMLTGRYHNRTGVTSTSSGGERLSSDESTIGDTFKAAGYATGAFGKWHNGMQWPYHPNARGFDEYYGFCSGHWGHYFSPQLEHNGKLVQGKGFITDDLTDHAIDFIEKNKNKPFFCYLPYNTPHSPMQVPENVWKKFDSLDLKMRHQEPNKENIQHTRAALAMCENIDWNVGRVLKKLDELDIAQNTIVIYFSDNGPNGWRWNGGMKGRKGSTDEGGVRSPLFIRWPGTIPSGTQIPNISAAIDLLPTLADLCGIPMVGDKTLDGVSIKPLLLGTAKNWPERMIFNAWKKSVSVRTQQHRLDSRGMLFDMEADPGQKTDISQLHPELTNRLKRAVENWKTETAMPLPNRPFTVGHSESQVTHLPARDAKSYGTIQRSSKHPNCSFFTNWTDTDDSITWDIEVLTPGLYQAQIYYTCKLENVGVQLELSFHDKKTHITILEAYDPPLVGEAEDRVPRNESYVKNFKPLSMGTFIMPKQRGTLTLRATYIPGTEAVDLRYVVLTRLDLPHLKAKPYSIGVAPSHIAEPPKVLFDSAAEWETVAKQMDMYRYYGVQMMRGPQWKWTTQLDPKALVDFTKARGIKLGCEFGSFDFIRNGKDASEMAFKQLDPIFEAGGTVSSIHLDGSIRQMLKGHQKHPNAMSLDDITKRSVRFWKQIHNKYPDMRIGLITNFPNWDYTAELVGYNGHITDHSGVYYSEALSAVHQALTMAGEKLDFVEVDCPYNYYRETRTRNVDSNIDNARKLAALQQWCYERGVYFNLIVNAEPRNEGEKGFNHLTTEYVRQLRRDGLFPDTFIIQSWYKKPEKHLPETEPYTFMNTAKDTIGLIQELYPRK